MPNKPKTKSRAKTASRWKLTVVAECPHYPRTRTEIRGMVQRVLDAGRAKLINDPAEDGPGFLSARVTNADIP